MSIVVRFNPTSMTAEKYDGSEGNLRVSEIWDSREQFEAFGERLMPVLTKAGIEFSGEPEIFEVHSVIKR